MNLTTEWPLIPKNARVRKARMLPDRLVLIAYRFWQVVATHTPDKHLRAVTGT